MTADLVGRVRARQEVQRAKSLAAASPAMVSAKHAAQEMLAGYNTQRTMTSTLDNSVEERGRLDEAVKRAVPVAEHLQHLLMTPGQSSVAQNQAASPQPGATPQGAVGGDMDDRAAEELLATLIDRETEISRLQETAKAQSTLISLLKASTSGIGGAGSPWVGGAAISESGSPAFRGALQADPRASHQLSDSDPMALSGPSLLEELALYKARASIMERRLEESLRRVTELEQQVVAMRFLAEEDTQAVRRRLQDAEQRAQDSLASAAQREAERDRALATGTRLETALRRREAHLANSGLETAGEGDVASVPATPAGGGLLNQSQSFIAMDSDVFAKTMAKLRPRLKIDEATATTILAEAVQSYEQLLNQVAQNNKAKKEARQQTMDLGTGTDSPGKPSSTTPMGTDAASSGGNGHPASLSLFTDARGPFVASATATGPATLRAATQPTPMDGGSSVGPAAGGAAIEKSSAALDAEDADDDDSGLHEQALLELLFDLKLKMWHLLNDYRSMRAIVDIKVADKEEEMKRVTEPLKAHIRALEEQINRLAARAQHAEAEAERFKGGGGGRGGGLGAGMTVHALPAGPPMGPGSPPSMTPEQMKAMERTLTEAITKVGLLKEQLKERGITPNCE
jgi:hypothetical protein